MDLLIESGFEVCPPYPVKNFGNSRIAAVTMDGLPVKFELWIVPVFIHFPIDGRHVVASRKQTPNDVRKDLGSARGAR